MTFLSLFVNAQHRGGGRAYQFSEFGSNSGISQVTNSNKSGIYYENQYKKHNGNIKISSYY
jgi:hypothetical protein